MNISAERIVVGVRMGTCCFAQGKVLHQVVFPDLGADLTVAAKAYSAEGVELPVALLPMAAKGSFALALPLVDTPHWCVSFSIASQDGSVQAVEEVKVSARGLRMLSKMQAVPKGAIHDELLCVCSQAFPGKYFVQFVQAVECKDAYVVRMQAVMPASAQPQFCQFDVKGKPLTCSYLVLEDGEGAMGDASVPTRTMTLSFKLPKDFGFLGVRVGDCETSPSEGFACLDAAALQGLLSQSSDMFFSAEHDSRYDQWARKRDLSSFELAAQSRCVFGSMPRFSIVVPLYNTPVEFFSEMVESVISQSYQNWELILVNATPENKALEQAIQSYSDPRIKAVTLSGNLGIAGNTNKGIESATGDFVAFFDHDDTLAPNALFEYAKALNECPDADVLYCDEDKIEKSGKRSNPFFKPDYSPDLLRSHNYITHLLVIRRSVIDQVGMEDPSFDGAQDYDLTLRACEVARSVVHIPRVLYHWRLHAGSTSQGSDSKPYAMEAGRKAVQAHCDRLGISAVVEQSRLPFAYRARVKLEEKPLVSVVIPNKDHVELLSACLDSLLHVATYENLDVIVVENNSEKQETFDYYESVKSEDSRVRVVAWNGSFNYSNVVNYGASFARGDYILFLNNDTEVISPDFLEEMVGLSQFPNAGVVGAKLLFKDGLIQHGGAALGPFGDAGHLFQNMPEDAEGYFCRNLLTQNLSVVTGACQLVRREVYEKVGGYDPAFEVAFNDVDFCLKAIRAGYNVVYTPHVRLYHYEFASRGRDESPERRMRVEREHGLLHHRWPEYFVEGDPFVGPNVDPWSLNFKLKDATHTSKIRRLWNALRG